MKIDGSQKSFIIQRWVGATLPNLAQSVALDCSELADLHSHLSFLGKWDGNAELEVATSRLCRVMGGAQVLLAEGVLALPRLLAQQFGTGGGL